MLRIYKNTRTIDIYKKIRAIYIVFLILCLCSCEDNALTPAAPPPPDCHWKHNTDIFIKPSLRFTNECMQFDDFDVSDIIMDIAENYSALSDRDYYFEYSFSMVGTTCSSMTQNNQFVFSNSQISNFLFHTSDMNWFNGTYTSDISDGLIEVTSAYKIENVPNTYFSFDNCIGTLLWINEATFDSIYPYHEMDLVATFIPTIGTKTIYIFDHYENF